MPVKQAKRTRCAICRKQATCYPFDVWLPGDSIATCEECARGFYGDDEIERLIALHLIKWKSRQIVSVQTSLPMEGATMPAKTPDDMNEQLDPELAKLLAQPPAKGWQPNVGDMLTGTVLEIDTGDAGGFQSYPLLTIQKDNGEVVAVHCFHSVLKNRVEHLIASGKLLEGSKVGIVYQGKAEGAGNYDGYEQYRFIVKAPSTPSE